MSHAEPQNDDPFDCSPAPAEVRRIAAELLPTFYEQLKHIAQSARARWGGSCTLQTTALVHEAYLRLRRSGGFVDEGHFLRASALAMHHALINHAAARLTAKRGGREQHVSLTSAETFSVDTDEGLVMLHEALRRLAAEMPRLAEVVECRFFGGYGEEDTARALGLSLRTVQRDWLKARAWLFRELRNLSD